jgi:hypothetical protein
VNPSTGSSQPDEWEVDLDLAWNVPAVKGLQVRFRNAYWDDGGAQTGYQFRVILNYDSTYCNRAAAIRDGALEARMIVADREEHSAQAASL